MRRNALLLVCLHAIVLATAAQTDPSGNGDKSRPGTAQQLNVTLAVFDPGIPADPATHRRLAVFPKIREVEARLLPFVLRETLVETDQWGAVRVVPRADQTAELLVTAAIVKSDGVALALRVRVVDATGREWLAKTYTSSAVGGKTDDRVHRIEPFQQLFDSIANDLATARDMLDRKELTSITQVAFLRYAQGLSEVAFGDYLQTDEDGTISVRRLPSGDDPLFARVQRIRRFEHVFTDTLDEQYEAHFRDIAPTYDLWRKYRRQLAAYRATEAERLQNRKSRAPRGSYEAMKKSYDNYKWSRIEAQNLARWSVGFNNEVSPTVVELEGRVVELKGGIDARYEEWRRILTSIFETQPR